MTARLTRLFWLDPEPIEVQAGLFLAALGVFLLTGPQTFISTAAYAGLARTADETAVGVAMLLVGLAATAHALIAASVRLRAVFMLVVVGVCAFWATLLWQGNPAGTGWVSFAALMLGPAWAAIRLGLERRRHGG